MSLPPAPASKNRAVPSEVPPTVRRPPLVSAQERQLARELVRTLRQAENYARRLDAVRGQAIPGEANSMDLARSLDAMVQTVCNEFLDSHKARALDQAG